MNEGKRPGGLTALGVLNIVFGLFGLLSTGAWFAILSVLGEGESAELDEAMRPTLDAVEQMGQGMFLTWVALSVVSSLLLLLAGIGYLKQKRFLGRTLGNGYAVLAIVGSILGAATAPVELGGGFSFGTMIGLVYPLITLYCINVVFKEDLVR